MPQLQLHHMLDRQTVELFVGLAVVSFLISVHVGFQCTSPLALCYTPVEDFLPSKKCLSSAADRCDLPAAFTKQTNGLPSSLLEVAPFRMRCLFSMVVSSNVFCLVLFAIALLSSPTFSHRSYAKQVSNLADTAPSIPWRVLYCLRSNRYMCLILATLCTAVLPVHLSTPFVAPNFVSAFTLSQFFLVACFTGVRPAILCILAFLTGIRDLILTFSISKSPLSPSHIFINVSYLLVTSVCCLRLHHLLHCLSKSFLLAEQFPAHLLTQLVGRGRLQIRSFASKQCSVPRLRKQSAVGATSAYRRECQPAATANLIEESSLEEEQVLGEGRLVKFAESSTDTVASLRGYIGAGVFTGLAFRLNICPRPDSSQKIHLSLFTSASVQHTEKARLGARFETALRDFCRFLASYFGQRQSEVGCSSACTSTLCSTHCSARCTVALPFFESVHSRRSGLTYRSSCEEFLSSALPHKSAWRGHNSDTCCCRQILLAHRDLWVALEKEYLQFWAGDASFDRGGCGSQGLPKTVLSGSLHFGAPSTKLDVIHLPRDSSRGGEWLPGKDHKTVFEALSSQRSLYCECWRRHAASNSTSARSSLSGACGRQIPSIAACRSPECWTTDFEAGADSCGHVLSSPAMAAYEIRHASAKYSSQPLHSEHKRSYNTTPPFARTTSENWRSHRNTRRAPATFRTKSSSHQLWLRTRKVYSRKTQRSGTHGVHCRGRTRSSGKGRSARTLISLLTASTRKSTSFSRETTGSHAPSPRTYCSHRASNTPKFLLSTASNLKAPGACPCTSLTAGRNWRTPLCHCSEENFQTKSLCVAPKRGVLRQELRNYSHVLLTRLMKRRDDADAKVAAVKGHRVRPFESSNSASLSIRLAPPKRKGGGKRTCACGVLEGRLPCGPDHPRRYLAKELREKCFLQEITKPSCILKHPNHVLLRPPSLVKTNRHGLFESTQNSATTRLTADEVRRRLIPADWKSCALLEFLPSSAQAHRSTVALLPLNIQSARCCYHVDTNPRIPRRTEAATNGAPNCSACNATCEGGISSRIQYRTRGCTHCLWLTVTRACWSVCGLFQCLSSVVTGKWRRSELLLAAATFTDGGRISMPFQSWAFLTFLEPNIERLFQCWRAALVNMHWRRSLLWQILWASLNLAIIICNYSYLYTDYDRRCAQSSELQHLAAARSGPSKTSADVRRLSAHQYYFLWLRVLLQLLSEMPVLVVLACRAYKAGRIRSQDSSNCSSRVQAGFTGPDAYISSSLRSRAVPLLWLIRRKPCVAPMQRFTLSSVTQNGAAAKRTETASAKTAALTESSCVSKCACPSTEEFTRPDHNLIRWTSFFLCNWRLLASCMDSLWILSAWNPRQKPRGGAAASPPDLVAYGVWLLNVAQVPLNPQMLLDQRQQLLLACIHFLLLNMVFAGVFFYRLQVHRAAGGGHLLLYSLGSSQSFFWWDTPARREGELNGAGAPLSKYDTRHLQSGRGMEAAARDTVKSQTRRSGAQDAAAVLGLWMRGVICCLTLFIFLFIFFSRAHEHQEQQEGNSRQTGDLQQQDVHEDQHRQATQAQPEEFSVVFQPEPQHRHSPGWTQKQMLPQQPGADGPHRRHRRRRDESQPARLPPCFRTDEVCQPNVHPSLSTEPESCSASVLRTSCRSCRSNPTSCAPPAGSLATSPCFSFGSPSPSSSFADLSRPSSSSFSVSPLSSSPLSPTSPSSILGVSSPLPTPTALHTIFTSEPDCPASPAYRSPLPLRVFLRNEAYSVQDRNGRPSTAAPSCSASQKSSADGPAAAAGVVALTGLETETTAGVDLALHISSSSLRFPPGHSAPTHNRSRAAHSGVSATNASDWRLPLLNTNPHSAGSPLAFRFTSTQSNRVTYSSHPSTRSVSFPCGPPGLAPSLFLPQQASVPGTLVDVALHPETSWRIAHIPGSAPIGAHKGELSYSTRVRKCSLPCRHARSERQSLTSAAPSAAAPQATHADADCIESSGCSLAGGSSRSVLEIASADTHLFYGPHLHTCHTPDESSCPIHVGNKARKGTAQASPSVGAPVVRDGHPNFTAAEIAPVCSGSAEAPPPPVSVSIAALVDGDAAACKDVDIAAAAGAAGGVSKGNLHGVLMMRELCTPRALVEGERAAWPVKYPYDECNTNGAEGQVVKSAAQPENLVPVQHLQNATVGAAKPAEEGCGVLVQQLHQEVGLALAPNTSLTAPETPSPCQQAALVDPGTRHTPFLRVVDSLVVRGTQQKGEGILQHEVIIVDRELSSTKEKMARQPAEENDMVSASTGGYCRQTEAKLLQPASRETPAPDKDYRAVIVLDSLPKGETSSDHAAGGSGERGDSDIEGSTNFCSTPQLDNARLEERALPCSSEKICWGASVYEHVRGCQHRRTRYDDAICGTADDGLESPGELTDAPLCSKSAAYCAAPLSARSGSPANSASGCCPAHTPPGLLAKRGGALWDEIYAARQHRLGPRLRRHFLRQHLALPPQHDRQQEEPVILMLQQKRARPQSSPLWHESTCAPVDHSPAREQDSFEKIQHRDVILHRRSPIAAFFSHTFASPSLCTAARTSCVDAAAAPLASAAAAVATSPSSPFEDNSVSSLVLSPPYTSPLFRTKLSLATPKVMNVLQAADTFEVSAVVDGCTAVSAHAAPAASGLEDQCHSRCTATTDRSTTGVPAGRPASWEPDLEVSVEPRLFAGSPGSGHPAAGKGVHASHTILAIEFPALSAARAPSSRQAASTVVPLEIADASKDSVSPLAYKLRLRSGAPSAPATCAASSTAATAARGETGAATASFNASPLLEQRRRSRWRLVFKNIAATRGRFSTGVLKKYAYNRIRTRRTTSGITRRTVGRSKSGEKGGNNYARRIASGRSRRYAPCSSCDYKLRPVKCSYYERHSMRFRRVRRPLRRSYRTRSSIVDGRQFCTRSSAAEHQMHGTAPRRNLPRPNSDPRRTGVRYSERKTRLHLATAAAALALEAALDEFRDSSDDGYISGGNTGDSWMSDSWMSGSGTGSSTSRTEESLYASERHRCIKGSESSTTRSRISWNCSEDSSSGVESDCSCQRLRSM